MSAEKVRCERARAEHFLRERSVEQKKREYAAGVAPDAVYRARSDEYRSVFRKRYQFIARRDLRAASFGEYYLTVVVPVREIGEVFVFSHPYAYVAGILSEFAFCQHYSVYPLSFAYIITNDD